LTEISYERKPQEVQKYHQTEGIAKSLKMNPYVSKEPRTYFFSTVCVCVGKKGE